MPWIELKIPCKETEAERLGDLLFELSALSVTFEDAQDTPIFEPEPGTMPLWQQTNVIALFNEDADLVPVYAKLKNDFPKEFEQHMLNRVEDQEWEKAYLDSFQPLKIADGFWICPSWHEPPEPEAVNILLDPGVAFGTGSHETTQLCLQALAKCDLQNKTVIDYGCGSGILAVAALKLGAKEVIAVDIHEQALEATQHNATLNGLEGCIITCKPDELTSKLSLNESQVQDIADVIVANILAKPLIELADHLIELLKTPGSIILSGLLTEQVQQVSAAYSQLSKHAENSLNEWACLEFSIL